MSLDATTAPTISLDLELAKEAIFGDVKEIKRLLAKGADATTGLAPAANVGNTSTVQVLLKSGADINGMSKLKQVARMGPPLLCAAKNGHISTVRCLLWAGANPNVEWGGSTPMLEAKRHGHLSVEKLLAEFQTLKNEIEK